MQSLIIKNEDSFLFKRHYEKRLNMLGERLSLVLVVVGLDAVKQSEVAHDIPFGLLLFCVFFCLAISCFFLRLEDRKIILRQDGIRILRKEVFRDCKQFSMMYSKSLSVFVYVLLIYGTAMRLNALRAMVLIFPTVFVRMFMNNEIIGKFMYRKRLFFSIAVFACVDLLRHFKLSIMFGYFFAGLASILSCNVDIPMDSSCFLFSTLYCIPMIVLEYFFQYYYFKCSIFTFILVTISSIIHLVLKSIKIFDVTFMIKFYWPLTIGVILSYQLLFLKELPSLIDISNILLIYYFLYKSLSHFENSVIYPFGNNNVYVHTLKTCLKFIMENRDSRSIFYFFLLNSAFMFIQMTYGILSNSLGLISDSIHMAFDCFALLVGLLASVMSKFPPSFSFPFGFSKIEVLSGFMNSLFLLLISISIIGEAVSRLLKPEEIHVEKLLIVSIIGLIVNLVGIFLFKHGHHHHHHHHHSNHSHFPDTQTSGDFDCFEKNQHKVHFLNDSVNNYINNSYHNANVHGVFLHIFADTLGSVGVVVSTLLIHQFGWVGFDSIASILIAVLIFISAIPLIISCSKSLLLIVPHDFEYNIYNALNMVKAYSGVMCLKKFRFWMNNEEKCTGVIHIDVKNDQDLNWIRQEVEKILKENIKGLHDITVVTEKRF
ncbi:uncharacterized protein T551_01739 [Pneumocystis jirovecii RU7]|uniref:Zinc transporter n=1 Tax=Pneumocystis jirovecii (strain RU7) TaxID=1408657 RepID=A0A0W4ZPZ7_PNEJ7|nr:uncharacterized protein T551_01739 [Pneumocystis jirovecii RU7]KTW30456.1 hypothetical protein T551_01739 [Pneumocystis jirovecii RU7]